MKEAVVKLTWRCGVTYKNSVSYPDGNRPLEGSMPRWEDTIVMDLE
jgi:hypothetical protein